ncbi:MAG: hypothetical protein IKP10_03710 [Clostridia bacterium]|nr:hypothetical protein [Clostridia bacterium]
MRKHIVITLALALALICLMVPALAAGKLTVTQENFHVVNSYSIYGYAFARVENTGDKPVEYSAALLEIYNKDGDTLASDTYPTVHGKYLQPGEYAYLSIYERVEGIDTYLDVDDYILNVTGKSSSSGTRTLKLESDTATYTPDLQITKYSKRNRMECTITNRTGEPIYDLTVVMALLDADGNILDVESHSLYSYVGLNPGSSITVRLDVSDAMREAYEREGLVPARVDAYAYAYLEE